MLQKNLTICLFLLITSLLSSLQVLAQEKPDSLILIYKDGHYGYINRNGDEVIKAQYKNALPFSEGLAAVRLRGKFGYINTSGKLIIPPSFDYASEFHNGLACAWKDGKAFYITTKGEKAFKLSAIDINDFNNGRAIVTAKNKNQGMINSQGKYILQPAYDYIHPFYNNRAVVASKNNFGVIDSNGTFVVPMGIYNHISGFSNGYASVEIRAKKNDTDKRWRNGFIDTTGKLVLSVYSSDTLWLSGELSEGMAKVSLTEINPEDSSTNSYYGFMNLKGEVLIDNPEYDLISPFSEGKAFVRTGFDFGFINKEGKLFCKGKFDQLHEGEKFLNGIALVSDTATHRWGVIDTTGNYIIPPQYDGVHSKGFQNGLLLVKMYDKDKDVKEEHRDRDKADTLDYYFNRYTYDGDTISFETDFINVDTNVIAIDSAQLLDLIQKRRLSFYENYDFTPIPYKWGIINLKGDYILQPTFTNVSYSGFENGLLFVEEDSCYGYVNTSGQYIWKTCENNTALTIDTLNIDYMFRGHFYASPSINYSEEMYNGWGRSGNEAKKITSDMIAPASQLSLKVAASDTSLLSEKYAGIKVYLTNTTGDTIIFDAQDSRLYMKLQAKDKDGKWKDIEYLPSSWCGNSYHTINLNPNEYWTFKIPVFQGEFKTQLRVALSADKKRGIVYSNTFDGSVNPGQFWRIKSYTSNGIMDPYND